MEERTSTKPHTVHHKNWNLQMLAYSDMRRILVYLTIRDVSALACVSKKLTRDIGEYWNELCLSESFLASYRYIASNRVELKGRLNGLYDVLSTTRIDSKRWLYTQIIKFKTYRQSVTQVTNFANLGKPDNIVVTRCEHLKRNIVVLKKIDWLHFFHKFVDVLPGRYRVVLRMSVSHVNFSTNKEPSTIQVTWQENNQSRDHKAEILYHQWLQLQQSFRRKIKGKVVRLKGATTGNFDGVTEFFDLCLTEHIMLCEKSDVIFEFKDIDNPGFKMGLSWDYIELRPII